MRQVSLRLMEAADKDSIHLFARSLPLDQLLFLHSDITDPTKIDEWIANIENGTTITLLAEPDGTLEGYASLHLNQVRWTRKLGELAINVAPEWQSRGLGEALCAEMLTLAAVLELRKVSAQMVADHKSARALFERLGFVIRAFLPDWIEDREGHMPLGADRDNDLRDPRSSQAETPVLQSPYVQTAHAHFYDPLPSAR